jgi:hypothetical protein
LPRNHDRGIIITLVAVFMLFVVGAMAALSIDVVTIYTARSEAQLAADSAALAGARVLANSGVTSNPSPGLIGSAWTLASAVATQVAEQNRVGDAFLTSPEITIPAAAGGTNTNPTITVSVEVTNLPTFFARIWGRTNFTVKASATAEAYNPSGANALGGTTIPVAPICVKPWLLPNLDPTLAAPGAAIFNPDGSIVNPALVNQGWPITGGNTNGLRSRSAANVPRPGRYYAGAIDAADFPEPTQALPACSAGFSTYPYMVAIAGCVPRPIACGATVDLAPAFYPSKTGSRDGDTAEAVECLIHYNNAAGDTDSIDTTVSPTPPFQFLAGNQNPVASVVGKDVLVSDSLVTIPVYDSTAAAPGASNPVTVIGFLQVFLNPLSAALPLPSPPAPGPNQIPVTIINMAGCGTGATGQPILGNGSSPVVVRLISPP